MRDKARVFLIKDDELIVSMVLRSLKNEGYEIQAETNTFNNIVSKIKSWSPDVVLLDIKLPERNGVDILKEIKDSEIDTQVVMLTADDTAETAIKCMKLGAVDYLTKPFNMDEVKIVISNIIEKERLRQEINYLRKVYSELFEKDIIGESDVIKELKAKMEKIAQAHVPNILITGEMRLIALLCLKPFLKVNYLATKRGHSQTQRLIRKGYLNLQIEAQYSLMR